MTRGWFVNVGGYASGGHRVWYYGGDVVERRERDASRHAFVLSCFVGTITHEILGTQHSTNVFRFIVIPVPFLEKNLETEMSPHHQKNLRQIVPPILSLRARLAQSDRASDSYL